VDLEPTDEQRELRSGAAALLADRCPPSLVRSVIEKGADSSELWAALVDQGWTALTVSESAGGMGLGPIEAGILAEELGRVVAPVPWWETVGAYASVVPADALADVVSGSVTATVAGLGDSRTGRSGFVAHRSGSGWVLDGRDDAVPRLGSVDRVAVLAQTPDGLGVFAVEAAAAPIDTIDATRPWAGLETSSTPAEHLGPAPALGVATALALLSAEAVGVCQALLEATIGYVKVREQFGVPIGSFQAVKHGLADAHLLVQRARAAVTWALLCLAEQHADAVLASHLAKVAASDAAAEVPRVALQYHGGIGYTWEHDLHLWLKRARTDSVLMGTAAAHRQRVADLLGLPA
jgi:alkylation response protein AidB-like acyl-CoA dehydrogenase